MEFGIFTNMYHPKHWRDGRVRNEHETLKNEIEYITIADRSGFKYSWSAEHHFLDEYSHLSDSESFMAYAMAKTADDRLALAAAIQFGEHGVVSVAVHPDWVRTEGVLQFADQVDLSSSQSPEGVGRAITALAGDPEVLSLTGQALSVKSLAARYGVDVSS